MLRELNRLDSQRFDVVIVGGGILGAFLAWDAALRGLSVAVVERDDFGAATTAGCGRVLHGGLRYLKRFDLALALEARREQLALRRLAPTLVRALPFVIPVGEDAARERMLLRAAAPVWARLTRLAGLGGELPAARFISAAEANTLDPRLQGIATSGALLIHDYQIRSPERLTIALLEECSRRGGAMANYAEATGLRMAGGRVSGIQVRDRLTGKELVVSGRVVVNAAGPWAVPLAESWGIPQQRIAFGKGIHLVVDLPAAPAALALPWRDAPRPGMKQERRNVFVMPWEGLTLVGATYEPHPRKPGEVRPLRAEIESFVAEIAAQWPHLGVQPSRVRFAYAGLYPVFGATVAGRAGFDASLHPLLVDHDQTGGPAGLISAVSAKLTTARRFAERIMDLACRKLAVPDRHGATGRAPPLRSANEEALAHDIAARPEVLERVVTRAVQREMAQTLLDVLLRRTHLGQRGHPGENRLRTLAGIMAPRLGWTAEQTAGEIAAVESHYAGIAPQAETASIV